MAERTRVYLENGRAWSIACAVDWPGWCRRGKGEEAAIETLLDYAPRYRKVAGKDFVAGEVEVIARVAGSTTTDFGAPDARGPSWHERSEAELEAAGARSCDHRELPVCHRVAGDRADCVANQREVVQAVDGEVGARCESREQAIEDGGEQWPARDRSSVLGGAHGSGIVSRSENVMLISVPPASGSVIVSELVRAAISGSPSPSPAARGAGVMSAP